jgi:hypothetical protein
MNEIRIELIAERAAVAAHSTPDQDAPKRTWGAYRVQVQRFGCGKWARACCPPEAYDQAGASPEALAASS